MKWRLRLDSLTLRPAGSQVRGNRSLAYLPHWEREVWPSLGFWGRLCGITGPQLTKSTCLSVTLGRLVTVSGGSAPAPYLATAHLALDLPPPHDTPDAGLLPLHLAGDSSLS